MVRIRLTLEGADAAAETLSDLAEALDKPAAPLLAALGQGLVSAFQDNIRTEGARLADRGIRWPVLDLVTVRIREHYGHSAGPRLIRTKGDLLRSINVLDVGDDFVEVGSAVPHARVLHEGGTWTDPKTGRERQVQAFPFVLASLQDVDDLVAAVADYYLAPVADA